MRILILNVGSATLKYAVFSKEKLVFKNILYYGKRTPHKTLPKALGKVMAELKRKKISVEAVGHRVVHGGSIKNSQKITSKLIRQLQRFIELAPLHNIPELYAIQFCKKKFPVPQIAIFDTAFHQTMPEKAYTYAIPRRLGKQYQIRRYGFHGMSHQHVAVEACRKLRWNRKKKKLITCHLGNGCSIAAIQNGRSMDTSMGFTPLEGLVMGTRSGDIDPGALLYLMHKKKLSVKKAEHLLNQQSGLLAISGISSDMGTLLKSRRERAKLAIEIFCYRLAKYIAGYIAVLGGADAVIFTGGIGEHAWQIRKKVMEYFRFYGITLDSGGNRENALLISGKSSKVKVLVIPTNEELMMVREVRTILGKRGKG
ncbi:acetate/propionate family kinase [Candidatus Woesearchaeota archaeon]|nr:acetate/propionate family kinase [Candidatus Woesearchaeota archaeon]